LSNPSATIWTRHYEWVQVAFDLDILQPNERFDELGPQSIALASRIEADDSSLDLFCIELSKVVHSSRHEPADFVSRRNDFNLRIGPSRCAGGHLLVEGALKWRDWSFSQPEDADWRKVAYQSVKQPCKFPFRFQFAFASWPAQVDEFRRGIQSLLARIDLATEDELQQRPK
jgi:hypothetical protein